MPEDTGQASSAHQPTTEDLREALQELGDHAWQPREDLAEGAPLPAPPTGGVREQFEIAEHAPRLDLREVIAPHPGNPDLASRRAELGLAESDQPGPATEQPS